MGHIQEIKINYCPRHWIKHPHLLNPLSEEYGGTKDEHSLWRLAGCLELIVSSQSFPEVSCLAAHKQVVLIHDFGSGQTAVLMKGEQQA